MTFWPFNRTPRVERDWISTGENRWVPLKEACGFRRERLEYEEIDLNTCERRWVQCGLHSPFGGEFIPRTRVINLAAPAPQSERGSV